jgi:hypothetical protein
VRGWDGTLTVDRKTNRIEFVPAEGSTKKRQYFGIEYGEDMVGHFKNWLDCCRAGSQDTFSPVDLAYRVQTALIMGMWSLRQGKTARFDTAEQKIII